MTAQEIIEALCEAQSGVTAAVICGGWDKEDSALEARRDAIKAALVAWLDLFDPERCETPCTHSLCAERRKLEEACRGK